RCGLFASVASVQYHWNTAVTYLQLDYAHRSANGFANTATPKLPYIAPFRDSTNQVNHLDSRFKDLHSCVLLGEIRSFAMDRITFFEFYGTAVINRIARHIKKTTEYTFTHRHRDWSAGIGHAHPALETLRR